MPRRDSDTERPIRVAKRRIEGARLTLATELNLNDISLTDLPESLGQLTQLRRLDLADNRLTALPDSLGKLTRLQTLILPDNQMTTLPESLRQLSQLEWLDLGINHLTALPEWVGQLSQLQHIFLHNNQLTALPEPLGQITQLRHLDVSDNQLTALPESLGQLTQLKHLDLTNNQLKGLPESLRKLTNLTELYLHDNPELRLPAEVLGPPWIDVAQNNATPANPAAILDYYFRSHGRKKGRPLNEFKLILVGRGMVGKTTLVHQLVHEKFVQKHKTKGIKVSDWQMQDGIEKITAHVWDFGGQEIMHGTHQFFLSERALYVLVLAGREDREEEDAEYWLKMIGAFGGSAPVFVVLNKIREHRFEVDEEGLKEKYPNIVGFYETDCRKNVGLAKLRKAIKEFVPKMTDVKKVFPAAWYVIKQQLPSRAVNFLSYDDYRKVCAELGEMDKEEQDKLAHFLHVLGIALNYRDDPRLSETSVLNPHWVTGGIYALLNDRKIMERRGVLRRSDLARVLKQQDYPAEKHDFLLLLMKKFELCFPLDDEGREWLVPDLLGKKGPKLGAEFDERVALCFEYRYDGLLPPGLIPRFISRAYTRIVDDMRWRTGVVVAWKGVGALVRGDGDKKRVEIRLAGIDPNMPEALDYIRSHFDTIHANFKSLNPREYVKMQGNPRVVVPVNKLYRAVDAGKETIEVDLHDRDKTVDVRELAAPFFGDNFEYPIASRGGIFFRTKVRK